MFLLKEKKMFHESKAEFTEHLVEVTSSIIKMNVSPSLSLSLSLCPN